MSGPSRINIKEANEHLQQLHQRVFELENQVQLQAIHVEELQRANRELQQRYQAALRETEKTAKAKDSQIADLTQRLQQSEEHVQKLIETAQERDTTMLKLEKKARLFYEVVEHKPVLAKMVEVLDELSREQEDLGTREKPSPGLSDEVSPERVFENGKLGGGNNGTESTTQGNAGSSPDTANR